jgi:uncharacterized protein
VTLYQTTYSTISTISPFHILILQKIVYWEKEKKMNRQHIDDMDNEIVKRLKPLKPLKILLFGSYASGAPTENSDIDICIVKENVKSKIEEKRKARKLLKGLPIAKDILIPSKSEYGFYKEEFGSVYMDIDKKGKLLWSNT